MYSVDDEPVSVETLATLGLDDDVIALVGGSVSLQPASTIIDSCADDLAEALEHASITPASAAMPRRGGSSMTQLPSGELATTRSVFRRLLGEKYGGTGATSSSRLARVKLSSMRPAAGGSEMREPDLSEVIFPRSYVLAPFIVRSAKIDGVMGPAIFVGVARVEDFVVTMPDGTLLRPEYLLPEQVPQTQFRLTFLHLAQTLSACALPTPDEADAMEEEMPPLNGAAAAAAESAADESGAGSSEEVAEEEVVGLFASPYAYTPAVYLRGGVVLANPALHSRGLFSLLSVPEKDLDAAKALFSDELASISQRELLNMKPRFEADVVSSAATERWSMSVLTLRARAAAVPEACRWPGCKEARFADKKNGIGRAFGMFKHLSVHAAVAAASLSTLEPAALLHAANACGLCGSSSAGCSIKSVTKRARTSAVIRCCTPPFCHKTPTLKASKAGKIKNVPTLCMLCNTWVWLFALRSHYAQLHADKELPPHALTEEGIAKIKNADRVKMAKPVADSAAREQRRIAEGARQKHAAEAVEASAPAAKLSRASVAGVGGGGGGSMAAAPGGGEGGEGGKEGGEGGCEGEEAEEDEEEEEEEVEAHGDSSGEEPVPEDDVMMPPYPKFKEGDAVTNMGLPGIVKEVILGNEATGGLPMYVVRFTDHKGGVVEAELLESSLSQGAAGARVRTSWKERSRLLSA